MICPKCGTQCYRDDANNGLAILYGPWGCPTCRWSEFPEYDLSNGQPATHNSGWIDQYGGWRPNSDFQTNPTKLLGFEVETDSDENLKLKEN